MVSADELQLHISVWLQCVLLMPSSEIRCQTTETTGIFLSFLPLPSSIQNHSSESTLCPVQKTEKIRCNLLCFTKCNGTVIWQSLAFHFPFVFKLLNWVSWIPNGNHGNLLKVSLRVYLLTGWESYFLWHWEMTHCQSIDAQPSVFLQGLEPLAWG